MAAPRSGLLTVFTRGFRAATRTVARKTKTWRGWYGRRRKDRERWRRRQRLAWQRWFERSREITAKKKRLYRKEQIWKNKDIVRRERALWTIELLEPGPRDRILDVGCGNGTAVEMLSAVCAEGLVIGIDNSPREVTFAQERNSSGIRDGRVQIHCATAAEPPNIDEGFDKIVTLNSYCFWTDPIHCLRKLRSRLKSGGVMAITMQPQAEYSSLSPTELGDSLAADLADAGFVGVDFAVEILPFTWAVCARGRKS